MHHLEILNDKEFEELTKDLLEKELTISLQNFKKGKDKGIDLRSSSDAENKIIVQVKHYFNSKYSDLKHNLIKEEKPKIEKLTPLPERYIVVTSLAMNPMEVDEVKEHLTPFIKSTDDIYHFDRIQSLITKYPDIEEKHYKLWLASTTVLQRILNNAVKGKSQFHEKKILKKLSLYVPTQNFSDAVGILDEKKFVIITGEPGVGKTTISYLLICTLLSREFKLVYIDSSIRDAEDILTDDPEDKQVIFFDDFLGSNIYEIINPKNSESSIIGFIERIQSLKNKFLILTTRTTILNQAEHNFEKLRQSKLGRISQYEVELKHYSKLDKARILYNHLYHSQLPSEYYDLFWENKNYLKIIEHRNYSPRLIEFITSDRHLPTKSTDYLDHIFHNLEYPNEIWKSAFEAQLSDDDRFLLTTLLNLGGYNVKQPHLEKAFEKRLAYEISENGHKLNIDAFNNSLKKLLDGFITSEKDRNNSNTYSFINPSVGDFLINYIKSRKAEKMRILKAAFYVDQLMSYFSFNKLDLDNIDSFEAQELYKYLQNKIPELQTINEYISLEVEILRIYKNLFKDLFDVSDLIPYFSKFKPHQVSSGQFGDLTELLITYSYHNDVSRIIKDRFGKIVSSLYQTATDTEDYNSVKSLFTSYGRDFDEFISDEINLELILESIANTVVESFKDNVGTSSYLEEKVIEAEQNGYKQSARSLISDALTEEMSDFFNQIDMDEYFDQVWDFVYIDEDEIIEGILKNSYVEPEPIYPPEFYHPESRSEQPANLYHRIKSQITKRPPTDSERINDLFDR